MTAERVTKLYDLVDAACDASEIHRMSERPGHVPTIDVNSRRNKEFRQELKREAPTRRVRGLSRRLSRARDR